VLAIGMALAGFGPAAPVADSQAADPGAEPAAATSGAPAPLEAVQVETVYLQPQATPEVIVNKIVQTTSGRHHDDDEDSEDGEGGEGGEGWDD
jgi:hypothetical protein